MKRSALLLVLALLTNFSIIQLSFAHGDEKHGDKAKKVEAKTQIAEIKHDTSKHVSEEQVLKSVTEEDHAAHEANPGSVHASLDDFPNRHPMVVHFPIVLLLVAAAVQLANIFFLKKSLDWVTTIAVLISFGAAYYVTKIDHPHTEGLTAHAKLVLEQHDFYADWTIYLSGIALVAQLFNQFLFKGKRWSVALVAVILAGAAYSVSMAGHYGAQLVFIEGVGPQGKYLDTDH
jgi:uncharacterized membrane protein